MFHLRSSKLAGAAAALLLTFVPAQGQEQEITAQEADAYFRQIQKEAVEIMRSRDSGRLRQWVEANIVDGAVMQASVTLHHHGVRKGFIELTLTKDDMLNMSSLFAGALGQGVFDDYALEVTVTEVLPLGPDAATASVRWTERISINPGQAGSEGNQPGQQRQPVTIEANADCTHLLRRSEDALVLGLSTCKGEVSF